MQFISKFESNGCQINDLNVVRNDRDCVLFLFYAELESVSSPDLLVGMAFTSVEHVRTDHPVTAVVTVGAVSMTL